MHQLIFMDPISDMLTKIRNAQRAGKANVEISFSKSKLALAKILEREKFIMAVEEKDKAPARKISVELKYAQGQPAIQEIKRRSKPSRRLYLKKDKIWPVKQGYGVAIFSTSKGLMTGKEAKKAGLGGEIICEIW